MLDINLDEEKKVLYIKPSAALMVADFLQLSTTVDAYVKQHGVLKGLIIQATKFPGWENTRAFTAHVEFIKKHHTKVKKIALVTNSKFALFVKNIIGPFLAPQIKHFSYDQLELAKQWVEE